ncbi:unnamed protein product [Rotaria sordida]|uniref:F-box domain-containing protein n=1 Tax=Rotaria sordida TaxID=392033 RepID=A0A814TAG1_9BILA|nr:unnamed protein product [Rotaria sordida]CAF3830694.1 unnamed protein product [Rotaria sordida]CAF4017563.1 unnamed protein product [Rotaria sordida]
MILESLTNESIHEIFEYLSMDHLLNAFYNLNVRFNTLIYDHIRDHNGLFQSISKSLFNIICIEYLPMNIHRIVSLHLSDNDDSPQQIECFFNNGFHLREFIQLRSLTLQHIHNENTMRRIIFELCYLPLLTELNLYQYYFRNHPKYQLKFVNSIWSLPKLVRLNLNIVPEYKCYFPVPTVISSSIKYLSVTGVYYESNQIDRLFQTTPRLRSLRIEMTCTTSNEHFSIVLPSLKRLNIMFHSAQQSTIENLLRNLPNLNALKIEMLNFCLNGHDWKRIITNYLLKLKRFEFKVDDNFSNDNMIDKKINQLLQTFRTQFWIDIHRWFVQCDLCEKEHYSLYTLPYAFKDFSQLPCFSKSTCSDDFNHSHTYDYVCNLSNLLTFSSYTINFHFNFQNLHQLSIKCPIEQSIWSCISNLNRLYSLRIYWYDGRKSYRSQLQTILNRAPNLNSLSLLNSPSAISQMISFQYRSISIRQLDLQPLGDWYNKQDCQTLSRSSLGIQCQTLCIRVENRACIFDLVHTMTNLRSLNVRCRDDTWNEHMTSDNDELIHWLKTYLPSTCTITRDSYSQSRNLRLWIR